MPSRSSRVSLPKVDVTFANSLPSAQHPPTLYSTVVIINEADSLTRDAQAALRRTMEKYMSNMRIILCANSTSKIIAPIRSRCLLVRVAAPNDDEVGCGICGRRGGVV
jgi:DNA polymerase III delta prime subunit